MAKKRIKDLTTEQATYDANGYLAVDKTGFSEAKKILIDTLVPKPNTLSAASGFNRGSTYMTLDDGSGNLYKLTPNQVHTLIKDLSSQSGPLSLTDELRYNKISADVEYQLTISSLSSFLFALTAFNTAVDARITNAISEVGPEELRIGAGTTYANLYAQKIDNMVIVTVRDLQLTGAQKTVDYQMSSSFRPLVDSTRPILLGEQDYNFVLIYGDGTITIRISDASGVHPSGAYLTTF